MKQKVLLLAGALVVMGSLALGGALSFDDFTPNTGASGAVDVINPVSPTVAYVDEATAIAADDAYHLVAGIEASSSDANYSYTVTALSLNEASLVFPAADCGDVDYGLTILGANSTTPNTALAISAVDIAVGSLYLQIDPVGTEELGDPCSVSGAVVTATIVVAAVP